MFSLRFDMRAPSFGAPVDELYQAALNICGWAEDHGCLAAVLCEQHRKRTRLAVIHRAGARKCSALEARSRLLSASITISAKAGCWLTR